LEIEVDEDEERGRRGRERKKVCVPPSTRNRYAMHG
jgi:hypothetical protein